jgi:hypothetical protein
MGHAERLVTPAILPQPHESLPGFLRRLASAQSYSDVSEFLSGFGLTYGRPMIESLESVELSLGVPPGSISAMSPRAGAERPVLEWRFQRNACAPVCPVCIAEKRPHHEAWGHVFVTACPLHDVALVGTCPLCHEPFQPDKGSYGSCACGCPLDRIPAEPAAPWEVAISALVAGEIHPSRALLPPALAFRTPRDIGSFLLFLGGSEARSRTGKPGKSNLPRTPEAARTFLAPISGMLCDWPNGFSGAVRERLEAGQGATLPERLGKWYHGLMRFRSEAYADFRAALTDVAAVAFDGFYGGAALPPDTERAWISAAEAARLLGVRAERVVDAVSTGHLEGRLHRSGFGHRHTVVSRGAVDALKAAREAALDKTGARDLLGITKAQYRLMEEAGVLTPTLLAENHPLVDGVHDRKALEQLVERITDKAENQAGETVAFSEISLRFTTDKAALLDLLRAIIAGAIAPCRESINSKLGDFAFPRAHLKTHLQDRRHDRGWSVEEVAAITGWKAQCIAHWCDLGLLRCEMRGHFRGWVRIIRPEELAAFQMTFLPVTSLAKELGTTSRKIMPSLDAAKVEILGALSEGPTSRGHLVRVSSLCLNIQKSGESSHAP